jgi:FlaA1/EpsC-like NDP-sugar epimerase
MILQIEKIIGRKQNLFLEDFNTNKNEIEREIKKSSFLIIGAAGSIGQAVSFEIFKRKPKKIHLIDISENNMVELVRNIRSSLGYIKGEFKTFEIDVGSIEFEKFYKNRSYDYIFNFSALKHVRSEKDPYTLMRMLKVNILNPLKILKLSKNKKIKKFFNVSTDKASSPANMMGASKRLMEIGLISNKGKIPIIMSRFANVLFSDGSLLHGFKQRLLKNEPIASPKDIKRYFITSKESAYLCIISAIIGKGNEIYYPKINNKKNLISFYEIALKFIRQNNFIPKICKSEDEARNFIKSNIKKKSNKYWPCFFFKSNTTGEKIEEVFYSENDVVDNEKFKDIGIVKLTNNLNETKKLNKFLKEFSKIEKKINWKKDDISKIVKSALLDINYKDKKKYLSERM